MKTKYSVVKYKKYESLRKFGIELEVANSVSKKKISNLILEVSPIPPMISQFSITLNNNYWHIKNDATCGPKGVDGPKGIEISSFVASGLKDLNHITEVADHLRKNKVKVNDNCGLHIHVDSSDLNIEQVAVIMAWWTKLQWIIFEMIPFRRQISSYCQLFQPGIALDKEVEDYTPLEFWRKIKPKNTSFYANPERRVNLNIVNFARCILHKNNLRNTLELRWPEGTLNSRDIKSWVKFFIIFIEIFKNKQMPNFSIMWKLEEFLVLMGLHHQKKEFYIFDKELFDLRIWFAERYILYGIGLCQEKTRKFLKNILIEESF